MILYAGSMTNLTPNAAEAYATLDEILANPAMHSQDQWLRKTDCGTVACFAGRVALRNGWVPDWAPNWISDTVRSAYVRKDGGSPWYVPELACDLLGIEYDSEEEHRLFHLATSREELVEAVKEIFGPRP